MIKQVKVKFKWGSPSTQENIYEYLTDIEDLKLGDVVVVQSKGKYGYGVTEVQEYTPVTPIAVSWVVQKVDIEIHKERIKRMKAIKDLEFKIEATCAERSKLAMWEQIAASDPIIRDLVDQLKALI